VNTQRCKEQFDSPLDNFILIKLSWQQKHFMILVLVYVQTKLYFPSDAWVEGKLTDYITLPSTLQPARGWSILSAVLSVPSSSVSSKGVIYCLDSWIHQGMALDIHQPIPLNHPLSVSWVAAWLYWILCTALGWIHHHTFLFLCPASTEPHWQHDIQ
jgi:hypothetical protein